MLLNPDNLPLCLNHLDWPCFYETWYCKLNFKNEPRAFWVRFSLVKTKKTCFGLVWATFSQQPSQVLSWHDKQEINVTTAVTHEQVHMGNAFFSEGQTRGEIKNNEAVAWELWFPEQNDFTFHYAPCWLRGKLAAFACSPHVNTGFSGKITVAGRTFVCDGEPGSQGHYFGKKYAPAWAWAHCNLFQNHSNTAAFEILDVELSPFLPRLKSAYLYYQGRHYVFDQIRNLVFARSHLSQKAWQFSASGHGLSMDIQIHHNEGTLAKVVYEDVDESRLVCYNNKLASSELTLKRQGRVIETLISKNTTAFERVLRP